MLILLILPVAQDNLHPRRKRDCKSTACQLKLIWQWEFGLGVAGQADLFIDGKKIIDNSTDQKEGLLFVSPCIFIVVPLSLFNPR